MKCKKLCSVLVLAWLAATGVTSAVAADADSFKAAYAAADAARKNAAAVGYEWRDTKKLLKRAKKAAEAGDYEKAEKLAMKAKGQGDAGVAQAEQQAVAWKAAVLR